MRRAAGYLRERRQHQREHQRFCQRRPARPPPPSPPPRLRSRLSAVRTSAARSFRTIGRVDLERSPRCRRRRRRQLTISRAAPSAAHAAGTPMLSEAFGLAAAPSCSMRGRSGRAQRAGCLGSAAPAALPQPLQRLGRLPSHHRGRRRRRLARARRWSSLRRAARRCTPPCRRWPAGRCCDSPAASTTAPERSTTTTTWCRC
mmetsp:Transcript_22912/g.68102  ORF Transcript_22912/g.68102 Transcript_22912/m.68102 type:complete len:202 (+) Transcript_22912:775-1380(+)